MNFFSDRRGVAIAALFSAFTICVFVLPTTTLCGQAIRMTPIRPAGLVPATPAASSDLQEPAAAELAATEATTSTDAASTDAATLDTLRVQMFLKAKIDRTPESILKAWKESRISSIQEDEDPQEPEAEAIEQSIELSVEQIKQGTFTFQTAEPSGLESGQILELSDAEGNVLGRIEVSSVVEKTITASVFVEPETTADVVSEAGLTTAPNSVVSETETDGSDESPPTLEIEVGQKLSGMPVLSAAQKQAKLTQQVAEEVKQYSKDVTLGNWEQVKQHLAQIKDKDGANQVYGKLLDALVTAMPNVAPAQASQQRAQMQQRGETPPSSFLTPDDILAISEIAPMPITVVEAEESLTEPVAEDSQASTSTDADDPTLASSPSISSGPVRVLSSGGVISVSRYQVVPSANVVATTVPATSAGTSGGESTSANEHIAKLAQLIQTTKESGYDFGAFLERIRAGTTHFGGNDPAKRLTAADLLMKAAMQDEAMQFLPDLDAEELKHSLVALRLWADQSRFLYQRDKTSKWLDVSWSVNQRLLNHENAIDRDQDQALTRLIELSTIVDKEIGKRWLEESFTNQPERGIAILANLGAQSASMARQANQVDEDRRLKMLRMQNEAVNKLLNTSPELAQQIESTLTLLAENWISESRIAVNHSQQTTRGGYMSIDMYGNYYWTDPNNDPRMRSSRQQKPIGIGDLLDLVPGPAWRNNIASALLTEIIKSQAELHLRINEEDKAFPFIESIAEEHPKLARELVHDFLKIWTSNHDPNTSRRQRNPYIYMYGFDQKADSIPLTRSKQERNLKELSEWVARIRKMPIEDVDEDLLANAFTTCHSSAEVYQLDRVRAVFGDLKQLDPETIAALCQKMRQNLSTAWRDIRAQEAKQTKRKLPEVQQEVMRGYQTAMAMIQESLQSAPENWQLNLAKACLMFDQNAYAQSVEKSSEFSDRRDAAFDQFAVAADKYRRVVGELEASKHDTEVYDRWFYAALGAVDLGKIEAETVPDLKQYARIREAIDQLPETLAESHLGKFANNLFTRMSPIKPELKFRYLRAGFEIVGDHPRAWEARNLYDYYKDLVTEIQLNVEIDGTEAVGTEPFGLYVTLKHTQEIEREAGGFGKYVQNQNSMLYAYNYGRPTEDYRDKFRDSVEQALGEHFEVVNVTFEGADTMKSRPMSGGWRQTPYAYVLLRARGEEVDRVPPLKLDLDFLDTSGYVVIPIESPALVVDAAGPADVRPIEDLKVTQVIDERRSGEGKLIVEVSASGKGLIPGLEEIIDTDQDAFEIVSVDDQGSLPTMFDPESDEIQIVSDRSWTIEYRAKDDAAATNQFSFGKIKRDDAETEYKRYEGADLVQAEPVITLERTYQSSSLAWLYWAVPLALLSLVSVALVWANVARRQPETREEGYRVPDDVNPFTVLTLLREIRHNNGLNDEQAAELDGTINRVESYYFGERENDQPGDLEEVARSWVSRAK